MIQFVQPARRYVLTIFTIGLLSCSGGSSSSQSNQTATQSTPVPDVASTAMVTTTSTIDPLVQNFLTTTTSPKVQESNGIIFEAGGNYSGVKPLFEANSFEFDHFNLQGANFSRAVLNHSWLKFSDFTESNFSKSDLSCRDSDIVGTLCASLDDAIFIDADLTYATMTGISAERTNFTRANLSQADFGFFQVKLDMSAIINSEKNWTPCSSLKYANFQDAKMIGTNLECAVLIFANLTNADLTNANLTGANLTKANLTGANLKGAKLQEAIVTGTIFTGATMPDGTKHP